MFSRSLLLLLTASIPAWPVAIADPNAAMPPANSAFAGVAFLGSCSGALLGTGMHVLTAAHCANSSNLTATFSNATGAPSYSVLSTLVHPDYVPLNNANPSQADLAILTLSGVVDPSIPRYQIYTGSGELGATFQIAGYGYEGTGLSPLSGAIGTLRTGSNQFDADPATLISGFVLGAYLVYDFDNGNSAQNSIGGTGLGTAEALGVFGDSGGPLFLNLAGIYYIAGVQSFGAQLSDVNNVPVFDIDAALNGTHGEWGGATRVSTYQNFFAGFTNVPEPGTFLLGGLGLAALLWRRGRGTRN